MANTYSQIYLQIVFAVRGRENLIQPEWKNELFKYITGIIKNNKQKLLAINGVSDHVHLLIGFEPNIRPSDLIRDIKANSSRFINEKRLVRGKFYWQEGFGAFLILVPTLILLFDTFKIRKDITVKNPSRRNL